MLKSPSLKVALRIFLLAVLISLQSCHDKEILQPQPQLPTPVEPIPPGGSLPDKLCKTNFQTGYTDKTSYFIDEMVTAFIQSNNAVDLCRLDIYDINGVLAFSIPSPLSVQHISTNDPSVNGFNFEPTIIFKLPSHIKSGIYQIENKIPFIVKTKSSVDLMIIYPSNTVNAYCISGGKSLYTSDRPVEVSFHRPVDLQDFSVPCLRWFTELSNYEIGYVADEDMDDISNISNSTVLIIVGHNEYWTRSARLNFDSFIDQGGHALILSGNTMWWQVRYSEDKSKLICYKTVPDPINDPLLKTTNWDQPGLEYSILRSIGADFTHGGYGLKSDNGWNGYKIVSPNSPLLSGLNLKKGDIITLPTVEFDGAPISSFDADGYPIIDNDQLDMYNVELIGFDKCFRGVETTGTFIVMQPTSTSGVIVNTSSTDWCSSSGMGGSSGNKIKKITLNAIVKLVAGESVFTP